MNDDEAIARLDGKIEGMRKEFSGKLEGFSKEVKELTKALRELIRLEGKLERMRDAQNRMGKEIDQLKEKQETTDEILLTLQVSSAVTGKSMSGFERVAIIVVTAIISSGAAVFITSLVEKAH